MKTALKAKPASSFTLTSFITEPMITKLHFAIGLTATNASDYNSIWALMAIVTTVRAFATAFDARIWTYWPRWWLFSWITTEILSFLLINLWWDLIKIHWLTKEKTKLWLILMSISSVSWRVRSWCQKVKWKGTLNSHSKQKRIQKRTKNIKCAFWTLVSLLLNEAKGLKKIGRKIERLKD